MPLAVLPWCFATAQSKNLLLHLPSQGALTHGDRRATESRDLSKYNFENKVTGLGQRGWEGVGGAGRGSQSQTQEDHCWEGLSPAPVSSESWSH